MEIIQYTPPKNLFQQFYENSTCFLFVYILGIFLSLSFILFFCKVPNCSEKVLSVALTTCKLFFVAVVLCRQATISVFHACLKEIESNVNCQVFNYHLIQSRQYPPTLLPTTLLHVVMRNALFSTAVFGWWVLIPDSISCWDSFFFFFFSNMTDVKELS